MYIYNIYIYRYYVAGAACGEETGYLACVSLNRAHAVRRMTRERERENLVASILRARILHSRNPYAHNPAFVNFNSRVHTYIDTSLIDKDFNFLK